LLTSINASCPLRFTINRTGANPDERVEYSEQIFIPSRLWGTLRGTADMTSLVAVSGAINGNAGKVAAFDGGVQSSRGGLHK
jgi:hypothetical protein